MRGLATWRLWLLRGCYLLLAAGLGPIVWPRLASLSHAPSLMFGVVSCMFCALSGLALLGLRYPLAMLPLLGFEIAWKCLWLLCVALPQWYGGRLAPGVAETAAECAIVVIFLPAIPWSALAHGLAAGARGGAAREPGLAGSPRARLGA